ncbi:hypothetical protein HPB50_007242 [Hyalomma asiaticum]|uniref:Uncharacterized protein n=1 Tax=Hyalomma asiaticum TaxID=266040 RepID=A0ACB7RJL8_HYAAI|nr:hypothetical protein HPB50_007242 [Hyalomma asiaticum]
MVSSVSAAEQRPRRFGASAKASRWLVLHCELCERHGTVYKAVVGEAGSLDVNARQKWLEEALPCIREAYADRDLYNGDETGLFFQMLPSKTHALKGDACKGGKQSKVRVTVFFCEGRDAPAGAEMTELWSSVNGGDGDTSGLEFLHADDAVATNEDLTDEAIVAAVTGAEDDSSDDEEEPEPMQVVSHQEALQMIDSLRDFVFAKNLPLGHAQQLDALQKDVNKMASKQSKLTAYGFLPAKK